jgi:type I restriction enzyme S subunit
MMKKSLCEISNPKQWKTISTDMLTETGYPVYGANGIIGYYSTYNHDCETLLITCRGATCGSLNICQPFSYVNGNAMALDSLSADIDIRYLYYYLRNRGLNDVITGSAQPQIVRQSLEKVIVEYPELNIQKSIVETLDKISKIISLRKQQLSKLDELVKSRFIELFESGNYPVCRLGDVCSKITDGTHKTPNYLDAGVTFISAKNIVNGELDFSDVKYISDQEYAEIQKLCQTEMGDILLTKSGSLGAPVIVKTTERI